MFSLRDIHTQPAFLPCGEERLGELLDQSVEIDGLRHGTFPRKVTAQAASRTPCHSTVTVPTHTSREISEADRNNATAQRLPVVNPPSSKSLESSISTNVRTRTLWII